MRVRATALNRADLLQVRGDYPPPPDVPPDVPGLEYAGEVLAVGAACAALPVGDRVMGLVGGGAWAEQLTTHEREALRMPEGMGFADAAALPEAYLTAFDALVLQGGPAARGDGAGPRGGQRRGLGGGAAVPGHGRARGGHRAQCGEAGARRRVGRGAHGAVRRHRRPRFADAVREATGGRGADLALDLVGGDYLPETLEALAPRGRVLLVGLVAGTQRGAGPGAGADASGCASPAPCCAAGRLEEKMALAQAAERQLLPLFDSGRAEARHRRGAAHARCAGLRSAHGAQRDRGQARAALGVSGMPGGRGSADRVAGARPSSRRAPASTRAPSACERR